MAKFSLASAPKTFKSTISMNLIDGKKVDIAITFKHKPRSEYVKLLDSLDDYQSKSKEDLVSRSYSESLKIADDQMVKMIMECVESWDMEDEFNLNSVVELVDNLPALSQQIVNTYRSAILEGRTKN